MRAGEIASSWSSSHCSIVHKVVTRAKEVYCVQMEFVSREDPCVRSTQEIKTTCKNPYLFCLSNFHIVRRDREQLVVILITLM